MHVCVRMALAALLGLVLALSVGCGGGGGGGGTAEDIEGDYLLTLMTVPTLAIAVSTEMHVMSVEQDGSTLTVTVDGNTDGQGTGTVNGTSFTVVFEDDEGDTTVTGTIDGDTLSGTVSGPDVNGTFTASVATAPTHDLTGEWDVYRTPDGGSEEGPTTMQLTASGNNITGTMDGGDFAGFASGDWLIVFESDSTPMMCFAEVVDFAHLDGEYEDESESGTWRATRVPL